MITVQAEHMMNQDNVTTPESVHAILLCESCTALPVIKWARIEDVRLQCQGLQVGILKGVGGFTQPYRYMH